MSANLDLLFKNTPTIEEWSEEDGTRIVIFGKEFAGKSRYAFTAPDPVVLFDVGEHNHKELIKDFAKDYPNKKIHLGGRYMVPAKGDNEAAHTVANKFIDDYHGWIDKLTAAKVRGTLVIDSLTMVWSLFQLGIAKTDEIGKAQGKKDYGAGYGRANAAYQALFTQAKYSGHRLIATARVSEVWANDGPTGRFDADWQKHTGNNADIVIEVSKAYHPGVGGGKKQEGIRTYRFTKATANKALVDDKYESDELDYASTMALVEHYMR